MDTVSGSDQTATPASRRTGDVIAPGRYRAVLTTGIYCRGDDTCAGRPKPEHVRSYVFAEAAEADGFRPCLRCRPDRLAGPAAWLAGPELVCRAVRLVTAGALDESTEEQLAGHLGVSARHLRRLFAEHVGATPDAVARSRRAHFARRLLDETDLPVARVAFAAGFGSVRQMNRVVRDVFRHTPTQLRARRRQGHRLVADGGLDLRLPSRAPFHWEAMLEFLVPRALPGVEAVDLEGRRYRRTIALGGHPGVLEVGPGAAGERDHHLRLRAHLPVWDGLIHVVARVRRLLDLDADSSVVDADLAPCPILGPDVARRPGVRVAGAWDGFEVAVRAILGQQVTVAGATTLSGRMVGRFGVAVPGLDGLGLTHLFPEPAVLADADLASIGLPAGRARAIRDLAGRVADGRLVLDAGADLDDTVRRLVEIRGVGPWTAHYVAMRSGGERDAFPVSDLGLRRSASRSGRPLTEAGLERRARAWSPWRAYAAMRLWTRSGRMPDSRSA